MTTCWHEFHFGTHKEHHRQCVRCGLSWPRERVAGWREAAKAFSAALAERDKEIERMSNTLKTVKAAMEVVSRTELDGSGGRDAIARRVEKRHGNAMAMAFKEVFDVLTATEQTL